MAKVLLRLKIKNQRLNLSPASRKIKFSLYLVLSLLLLLLLPANFVSAQDTKDDDEPLKIKTLLLNIPLTVTDSAGHNIAGLTRDDFSIYQDGEKQDIAFFLSDDAPMNVAILIDTSGSTIPISDNIHSAAKDFIKVFRPEDKGLIVAFSSETTFLSELTAEQKKLTKGIDNAYYVSGGGSDMNTAVYYIIKNYFSKVRGRKAIIVLTDGMVYSRNYNNQQILKLLQLSNTLFYPIIFKTNEPVFSRPLPPANNPKNAPPVTLKSIAEATSGRYYEKDATKLKEAFQSIAEELKKQYLVGYYPPSTGKPVDIKITVNRKNLTIQAKRKL